MARSSTGSPSYYDTEAPAYDESRGGRARGEAAASAVDRLTDGPGVLLDVAGGTGIVTVDLARRGFTVVLADLSLGMLALASARLPGRALAASGDRLPVRDASVDVVTMIWLLHLVPVPVADEMLAEAARVLRPRGLLITTVDKAQAHGRRAQESDRRARVEAVTGLHGLTLTGETAFTGRSAWGSATAGDPVFPVVALRRSH